MARGTVTWFNYQKGYGFITGEDGNDVFVHFSGLNMEGFKTLEENQTVEYDVVDGEKGPSGSVNIKNISKHLNIIVPKKNKLFIEEENENNSR